MARTRWIGSLGHGRVDKSGPPVRPVWHGADRFYALGVYIRRDQLSGVVIDVHGRTVELAGGPQGRAFVELPLRGSEVDAVVRGVADLSDRLRAMHPDFASPLGLGVTLSGHVDWHSGTVWRSNRMAWERPVPLAQLLSDATGFPAMVEHDVTALTLAEQMFGLGQGRRSFAVVTVGIGVGAGLVIDYRLWRGRSDTAGELGHMVVTEPGGSRCICGNRGCLETVAGSDGILRAMRQGGRPGVDHIDAAAQLAERGDEVAIRAFERAGNVLGYGLSWLVNLLNLEMIVVRAGETILTSAVYEQAARRSFHEHAFHGAARDCELHVLPRDQELGARSAASMIFRLLPDQLPELGDAEL
jgi:predicted NBD/HSP70 family sugar kinase